jgi:hypothetical protein
MMAKLRMAEAGTPMPSSAAPDEELLLSADVENLREIEGGRVQSGREGKREEKVRRKGAAVTARGASTVSAERGSWEMRRNSIDTAACVEDIVLKCILSVHSER